MKHRLAALVATGALTAAALAGTVSSANAAAASPDSWRIMKGPFATPQQCVNYVASIHELGVWDCEYTNAAPFAGNGWYALSPWYD